MMNIRLLTKIAATTLGIFLMAGTGAALASTDHTLYIEDHQVELNPSLSFEDGRAYAPVRAFSEQMGWQLDYDKESGLITVANAIGDALSFQTGSSEIQYNGTKYEIAETIDVHNGNAYFPLRMLAEAMHASVGWKKEENAPVVHAEPEEIVDVGETLWSIAQAYGTTVEALQTRNGISDAETPLQIGQHLKVIVPEFQQPGYDAAANKRKAAVSEAEVDPAELALLAKLVQVEAGNEPYEGKLAVASVVMNRVKSGGYPNTVKAVIYAPHQFPPATNGLLDKAKASADCTKAAKAALSGENNVPGALFFFNPKVDPDKLKRVTVVKKIGSHVFAK